MRSVTIISLFCLGPQDYAEAFAANDTFNTRHSTNEWVEKLAEKVFDQTLKNCLLHHTFQPKEISLGQRAVAVWACRRCVKVSGTVRKTDSSETATVSPPPSISPLAVVRRSLPVYVGLLALGTIPLIDLAALSSNQAGQSNLAALNAARLAFFSFWAIGAVYIGAERQDIGMAAPITGKNAALAPVGAALTLGVLYAVIKYTTLDPGQLYRGLTSFFGWLCLTEVLQPLISLSPFGELLVKLGAGNIESDDAKASNDKNQDETWPMDQPIIGETLADAMRYRAGGLPAAVLAGLFVFGYFQVLPQGARGPELTIGDLREFTTFNNFLAISIAIAALGQLSLESYAAGAFLLLGLFFYDALSVFKSDAMVTVATKIEAPVKLLFARDSLPPPGKYPFSVLGLGDIVIPGAFIAMLRQFDIESWIGQNAQPLDGRQSKIVTGLGEEEQSLDLLGGAATPYFQVAVLAYAVGLAATFGANELTGKGQPALFYIVPSLLIASLATAASRGEFETLLAYKGARAAAAKIAAKKASEAAKAKKEESKRKLGQ